MDDEATSALEVIARRVRPQIIFLKDDLTVSFAEWDTGIELFRSLGLKVAYEHKLLPAIEQSVSDIVASLEIDPGAPCSFTAAGGVIVSVSLLNGGGARRIALYIEPSRRREDLRAAARRFSLTQRQLDVLSYLLQGLTAREIADELGIAETTVGDYFKQLLSRTKARNRADMIARVLNWSERHDYERTPGKEGR
ncbi:MAG: helix-turn-helix transcriptional regulator [Candidatus Aquilonibacter sp.]